MVKSQTSQYISALQDTCGNSWNHSYVYSSYHIELRCVGLFHKQVVIFNSLHYHGWACDVVVSQIHWEKEMDQVLHQF